MLVWVLASELNIGWHGKCNMPPFRNHESVDRESMSPVGAFGIGVSAWHSIQYFYTVRWTTEGHLACKNLLHRFSFECLAQSGETLEKNVSYTTRSSAIAETCAMRCVS